MKLQDAIPVPFDRQCKILDRCQSAAPCPLAPPAQIGFGQVRWQFEECPQSLNDPIGTQGLPRHMVQRPETFFLPRAQMCRISQSQILTTLQIRILHHFFPPHDIKGFTRNLHHMKTIEGDRALGKHSRTMAMKAGDISVLTCRIASGSPTCAWKSSTILPTTV